MAKKGKKGSKHLRPLSFADSLTDRLSIRQRLVGAIVLILGLFGLGCLLSLATFAIIHCARAFAESTSTMLVETSELGDALNRQESALRGYTLSGAPRDLQTLEQMHDRASAALATLDAIMPPGRVQHERLARIRRLESRWYADVAKPIIQNDDVKAARRRLNAGASLSIFKPMRAALAAFRSTVLGELDASNAALDYRTRLARWTLIAMLVFGLVVGLVTVRAVIRRVTRPLSELTRATRRLARDERDVFIGYQKRDDEIGAIARAIEAGRRLVIDQDRQAWVGDHRARLTALLHQCGDQQQLGDRLLNEIAALLGAGYAALFTPASLAEDEACFSLLSAYAYDPGAGARFGPGEGLVGQALVARAPIVIEDVPARYLPARSGLGAAPPTVLVLMPAVVGGQVAAVFELALFRRLRPLEMSLLETLLPDVALALRAHARARRTTELLEQSRAQGRALNVQSAELRASEEELRVQTEALRASNEELREKQALMRGQQSELAALHVEAKRRADALARANQYKSDFLANISHELRSPLNSLLILARGLADNEGGNLDAEQTEAAGIIFESGRSLLALINDILDLSKIEAGKMRVRPAATDLESLARRLQRHFAHMAADKGLAFDIRRGEDVPATVVTDGGKLEQIARNLIGNAIKFTERGAVTVELAVPAADTVFKTKALKPDNALAIHVSDDGIGIAADRLEQVFQAFEQVHTGASRGYGGTGLGLSISRELARLLGGEITVASTPGRGSRFSLFIRRDLDELIPAEPTPDDDPRPLAGPNHTPALAAAPAAKPAPKPADEASRLPLLLVIDDDPFFVRVICAAAGKRGFECVTADNGERGLAAARHKAADAIILDLCLPGMDGWAVLDGLRGDEKTRDIPVQVVSAAGDDGRSRAAGAVGFIQKPIARHDLELLLARAKTLFGCRLLVVDDDEHGAYAEIARLFGGDDRGTAVAASGRAEGLRALGAQPFDCVVLALQPPDSSGFELLEQIAARANAPPIVVYSVGEPSAAETETLGGYTDSVVIKDAHAGERLLDEIALSLHRWEQADHRALPPPPATKPDHATLAGAAVLIVDDDMRNAFALSRVLRDYGLKVLMAGDGAKALAQLAANDPIDGVLMDIMMPGMDGFETIRRIRAQPRYTSLPIIALTAKAMAGDREACLAAGASAYLAKPLDIGALFDTLASLLK